MIRLRKNVLFVILMTILALFLFNCEGPAGEDGTDGADGSNGTAGVNGVDGVDGNVTCLVCHSDENLAMKQHEFAASQHSSGDIAVSYAGARGGARGCYPCHSHEQFVAFTEGLPFENIASPSPWKCSTCHGLHQTFEAQDYALRVTEAVAIFDGSNFALKGNNYLDVQGNSNLCATCHQSRRAEPNVTDPGATFDITSTHYGPHHGPQANVLAGVGFAEIAGSIAYPVAGSADHIAASCTGCHMYEGDHSFNPSLDACNVCHATADFNYGGVADEMADLLEELRDLLIAKDVIELGTEELYELNEETGVIELVVHTEGYHPVVGEHPMVLAQAFFNWVGLAEDRSLGAHNPKYYKALLKNSIDAVNAL